MLGDRRGSTRQTSNDCGQLVGVDRLGDMHLETGEHRITAGVLVGVRRQFDGGKVSHCSSPATDHSDQIEVTLVGHRQIA